MKSKICAWFLVATTVLNLSVPNFVSAEEVPSAEKEVPTTAFDLKYEPTRSRTFLLPPLTSLFLPGFDQWWEGQFGYAAAYTGVALGGYGLGAAANLISPFPERSRFSSLGTQIAFTSGSMSAYHSFRSAVKSRQSNGDFSFLKHEESPTDLMLAPFQFSYFSRPTTYIGLPAHLLVAFLFAKLQGYNPVGLTWKGPSPSDVFFSGAYSYNAGVGEEALFRGWLMPVAMHYMNSEIASNMTTSLIFGALHYKSGYIPISQTLAGFYLGYLTQKNEWQLGESIFNHTWFDVIVFLIGYSTADIGSRSKVTFELTPISIPF